MPNGKKPRDRNRVLIEPAPESRGEVIDPTDPNAQRRFQIQERGGQYSDRIRINPFRKRYLDKRLGLRNGTRRT